MVIFVSGDPSIYNLKIIPEIKSVSENKIICGNDWEYVSLSITGGIVGNLSAFTDFTNPTGYFNTDSYQIYGLTSGEFNDLSGRTAGFTNHINFVNQFVTTQFLANKNGDLKHLDNTLEIRVNETQTDLWTDRAGNFPGLSLKFNQNQFRIDPHQGLTIFKTDFAAPKFHEHSMADVKDWDSVSAELSNYFSPFKHTHNLINISDWDDVSGANLSELHSDFYDHLKNHPNGGGSSSGTGLSYNFFPDFSRKTVLAETWRQRKR